jgi:hypothetical protein
MLISVTKIQLFSEKVKIIIKFLKDFSTPLRCGRNDEKGQALLEMTIGMSVSAISAVSA